MDFNHVIIAIKSDIHREGLYAIIRKYCPDCKIKAVHSRSDFFAVLEDSTDTICLFSASTINSEIDSFIESLHTISSDKKTMMMIHPGETVSIEKALRAGVNGLFTPNCSSEDVIKIMNDVSSGIYSFSKAISNSIMINFHELNSQYPKPQNNITNRESEILTLIVNGFTSAEIAKKLFISPRTVETHRCNLMKKLKLKNTAELVRFAMKEKRV